MSAWDPSEDFGHWSLASGPDELREIVDQISKSIRIAFTDEQLDIVCALLRLPQTLLPPLARDLREGFCLGEWLEYLNSFLKASPTFAGTTDGETGGGGCSSSWTCYWDCNPAKATKVIGQKLEKNLRALREIAKQLKRLPPHSQE